MKVTLGSGNLWGVGGNGTIDLIRPDRSVTTKRLETTKDFSAIYFIDQELVGYVVGTGGSIFSSIDSGQNWTEQNSERKEDLEAIDCIDRSTCWAVGWNGVILSTVNGGAKWDSYQFEEKVELRSVSFVSQKEGWTVGANGTVLRTADGGRSWNRVKDAKLAGNSKIDVKTLMFTAVKFFSQKVGCLAGDSRIICTANGGRTWKYTATDESFYANRWLGFVSNQNSLMVVGKCVEGDFVSSNRGKSWSRKKVVKQPATINENIGKPTMLKGKNQLGVNETEIGVT